MMTKNYDELELELWEAHKLFNKGLKLSPVMRQCLASMLIDSIAYDLEMPVQDLYEDMAAVAKSVEAEEGPYVPDEELNEGS